MPAPQEQEIEIQGRTFISLKYAAELSNYTHDYVGQRARNGYLTSQKINGERYVDKEEFIAYARETGKLLDTLVQPTELNRENSSSNLEPTTPNLQSSTSDLQPTTYNLQSTNPPARQLSGAYVTRSYRPVNTQSARPPQSILRYHEESQDEFPLIPTLSASKEATSSVLKDQSVPSQSPSESQHEISGSDYHHTTTPRHKVIQINDTPRRPVGGEVRTPSVTVTQSTVLQERLTTDKHTDRKENVMHIVDGDESRYTEENVRKPESSPEETGVSVVSQSVARSLPNQALSVYVPRMLAIPQQINLFFRRQSPLVKAMTLLVPVSALTLVLTSFNVFGSLDQARPITVAQARASSSATDIVETFRQGVKTLHSVFSFVADRLNESMEE